MEKVKSIGFIAGLMILILAAVMICLSVKRLFTILSVEGYEDRGTHTFEPYRVLPVQVQNTSAYSRDRRMNPTKTVYMVYYRATDGSGYEWSDRAITRELGQKTVKEGVLVTRRVLSIPSDRTYCRRDGGISCVTGRAPEMGSVLLAYVKGNITTPFQ